MHDRRILRTAQSALRAGLELACSEEETRGSEDRNYEIKAGPTARKLRLALEKVDAALARKGKA